MASKPTYTSRPFANAKKEDVFIIDESGNSNTKNVDAPRLQIPTEVLPVGIGIDSLNKLELCWRFFWIALLATIFFWSQPIDREPLIFNQQQTKQVSIHTFDNHAYWHPRSDEASLYIKPPLLSRKPFAIEAPGITWLHQLAFSGLRPESTLHHTLVLRMHITQYVLYIIAIGGMFILGVGIGSLRTATLTSLIFMSTPAAWTVYTHISPTGLTLTAFIISCAAAVWGIRPLRPSPGLLRQATGWIICGVGIGITTLSGGISTLIPITASLMVILLLCPHRISHTLGLLAALFTAALVSLQWTRWVLLEHPSIASEWLYKIQFSNGNWPSLDVIMARFAWGLTLIGAWSLWIPSLCLQIFSKSSRVAWQRLSLGMAWFIISGLLLMFAPASNELSLVPLIIPSFALFSGQIFRLFSDISDIKVPPKIWRITHWPYHAVLLFATCLITCYLLFGYDLPSTYIPDHLHNFIHNVSWPWLVISGSVLVVFNVLGLIFGYLKFPSETVVMYTFWHLTLLAAIGLALNIFTQSPPL